jgi:hypothetical protein
LALPETFSFEEKIPNTVAQVGKITKYLIPTDGGTAVVENDTIKLTCDGAKAGLGVAPTSDYQIGH